MEESNKNVCGLIRNLLDIDQNQDIREEFLQLTNLDRIEEQLFGSLDENHEYFILRLYVK